MEELIYYYPKGHETHFQIGHPERPERVEVLVRALQQIGRWDRYPIAEPASLTQEFLGTVHSPGYLSYLKAACRNGEFLDMDTYTTPASWGLALNAAGGAAKVAQSVWNRQAKRGVALTRPPGHHATRDFGMGFCLINNVAVAAEYLLQQPEESGSKPRKLAIVDLDLHHGNGSQDIFWERGEVVYISTHQSPHYPGTGALDETGAGAGAMTKVNIPLPAGTGDTGYAEVMESIILPLLDRFSPEILLISFGFDPHWRDPLGQMQLSASGYGNLVKSLADWADKSCDGRIALFLEGGYDLEAGAACIQSATAALLDFQVEDKLGPSPRLEGRSWERVLPEARKIWGL